MKINFEITTHVVDSSGMGLTLSVGEIDDLAYEIEEKLRTLSTMCGDNKEMILSGVEVSAEGR